MEKITQNQKDKIKLALELLCDSSTSLDKIQKLSQLLKGLNSKVDKSLDTIIEITDKIKKVQEGDVITLSSEQLPEETDKQKHVKKLVLLLITHWKDLQSEIIRLNELQAVASSAGALNQTTVVKAGKIATTMKGPLGVITIVAAGVVAASTLLNNKAVNIEVQNQGCSALGPFSTTTINIPGLKVPSTAILKGKSETVKLPGVDVTVNASNPGVVEVTAFNYSQQINLPYNIKDVTFDGESIMGKTTLLNLSNAKTHEVVVKCK